MRLYGLRAVFYFLIMIVVLVFSVLTMPQKALAQTSQPNIIFVLVDDMDADTINIILTKLMSGLSLNTFKICLVC
jgi:N-acetylglucosamine-6-sulfatase